MTLSEPCDPEAQLSIVLPASADPASEMDVLRNSRLDFIYSVNVPYHMHPAFVTKLSPGVVNPIIICINFKGGIKSKYPADFEDVLRSDIIHDYTDNKGKTNSDWKDDDRNHIAPGFRFSRGIKRNIIDFFPKGHGRLSAYSHYRNGGSPARKADSSIKRQSL